MDRMGFIMTTIITGTTIITDPGGGITDIDLGVLGRISTNLIITDGHTMAIIMVIILILIMDTIHIIIITNRVTTKIQTSMWQVADGEALQQG